MDLATRILTARLGQSHIFYVGQAGYIIKSKAGTLLGVDMYLTDCVERAEGHMGFKRLTPKLLEPSELQFDYVLATHPHYDHFDMDAMPILLSNAHTHLFASVNCKHEIQRLIMEEAKVTYIKIGDTVKAKDIIIDCVFCDHGVGTPDAVGLVITMDEKKIYIAGDTCLRLDKVHEIKKKGPFDIMIAPINGAYRNLNEHECVALAEALNPKLVIPCHYGTFASHGGNPGVFVSYIKERLPQQKFLLMAQGEQLALNYF